MIDLGEAAVVEVPARPNWILNMVLVRLPSGGVLVHSPTWRGDAQYAEVESVGRPEVLFAPNHYHHLSLPRFRERYPGAIAVCSDGARPRLERKGHTGLRRLDEVKLPQGAQWIELPQVKTGEAWLSLRGDGGPTWIVCDGFMNVVAPPGGAFGFVLRSLDVVPGLKLSRTFKFLMKDKRAYRAWLLERLRTDRPARVLFSHGSPLVEDATPKLIEVVEKSLPA